MSERTRLTRWRLVLGDSAEQALGCGLDGADKERDEALGYLAHARQEPLGLSTWIGALRLLALSRSGRGHADERMPNRTVRIHATEPSDRFHRAQRHMQRVPWNELGPRLVTRARPEAVRFATRTRTLPTAVLTVLVEHKAQLGLDMPLARSPSLTWLSRIHDYGMCIPYRRRSHI